MEERCKICNKSLKDLKELVDYLHFKKNNKSFYICVDDLKVILNKLTEILKEPEPYIKHMKWLRREKVFLQKAKNIYKECKTCFNPKIDLKKMDDKIYDLMCEECWEKFRKNIEKKYK